MNTHDTLQKALEKLVLDLKAMFSPIIELSDSILFEIPIGLPFLNEDNKKCVLIVDGAGKEIGVYLWLDRCTEIKRSVFEENITEITEDDDKNFCEFFSVKVTTDWLKMRILEQADRIKAQAESHYQQLSEEWKKIKTMV